MQLQRLFVSLAGLLIGLFVYTTLDRLSPPWNGLSSVAFYLILAVLTWFYAGKDRFVKGVAIALGVWSLIRLVLVFVQT